jgi:hypothetical protein
MMAGRVPHRTKRTVPSETAEALTAARQYATPLIVRKDQTIPLTRVLLGSREVDEGQLQRLLFAHPSIIPVDEIEPVFAPLAPVARELPTPAGLVDVLYANADGFLTVVETKLWRSPQGRREVVAQIIDYATALANWTYDDLVRAVRKARKPSSLADPLVEAVGLERDRERQTQFIDSVNRNLQLGRVLLLVVGDGIQEGIERMADFLATTPRLQFTLALVELALFRIRAEPTWLFVQPRVVARTREVVRAIVDIRTTVVPQSVSATVPSDDGDPKGRTITEEAYLERLGRASAGGPGAVQFIQGVLTEASQHRLDVTWATTGPSLRYHPDGVDRPFKLARFRVDGLFGPGGLRRACERAGVPIAIADDYLRGTAKLIPNAVATGAGDEKDVRTVRLRSGERAPFRMLVPVRQRWWTLIDRTVDRIDRALEGRSRRRAPRPKRP